MYTEITNPKTLEKVSINSPQGKRLILNYLNFLRGGEYQSGGMYPDGDVQGEYEQNYATAEAVFEDLYEANKEKFDELKMVTEDELHQAKAEMADRIASGKANIDDYKIETLLTDLMKVVQSSDKVESTATTPQLGGALNPNIKSLLRTIGVSVGKSFDEVKQIYLENLSQ